MGNDIRFRNHISIVFERLGRMLVFVFVTIIGGIAQNAGELAKSQGVTAGDIRIILMAAAGGVVLLIMLTIWQAAVWARTYISVCDYTIVIERNTLNRKKNTIGIKNISNVNTEQNLFEMLLGTSKVKLDTNSLSTADQTDVKIILKKKEAEAFRSYVMTLMEQSGGGERDDKGTLVLRKEAKIKSRYEIRSDFQDIVVHGAFSVSLFSLLVVIGGVVGMAKAVERLAGQPAAAGSLFGILASSLVAVMFVCSAFWDILKGFVKYYDFRAAREGDKLYINYGVLKKVSYTIPVDKINALKLAQSPLARLTGWYRAEIINVGMGDDEAEKQSFLVLYCKKAVLEERICRLLPEFGDTVRFQVARQPGSVWAASLPVLLFWFLLLGTGAGCTMWFFPEYGIWVMAGVAGTVLLTALLLILWYMTAGCEVSEDGIAISGGYIGRRLTFVPYGRVQYVELAQNFIAKRAGIQKGRIYLLAGAAHKVQGLPYFYEKYVDMIKMNMLS